MAIDLFPSLKSLGGNRDLFWYDDLSDEDKKTAHPFVLGRWLTGTHDAEQILRLNERVNPYMFSLGNEKPLLFKLLASASTGRTSRYQWIKAPGSAASGASNKVKVIAQYYEVSLKEASTYLHLTKEDDIMLMADELGWGKEDIAALKKELTNGSRVTKSGSAKAKRAK